MLFPGPGLGNDLKLLRFDRVAVVQNIRRRLQRLTFLENGQFHVAIARFAGHFTSSKRAAQGLRCPVSIAHPAPFYTINFIDFIVNYPPPRRMGCAPRFPFAAVQRLRVSTG
ncbi:hypothetical protein E3U26_13840 (plasmid) [Paracoccus ferrooxidans]|nr:hypothetical protein E3U26_13840 [Paracoccus ferrooxidans]